MSILTETQIPPPEKKIADHRNSHQATFFRRIFSGLTSAGARHGNGTALLIPPEMTLFHITHWKAGSQWIGGMLQHIFTPDFEPAEVDEAQVFTRPIKSGKVYRCVYVSRQEYQSFAPASSRYFVLLRDLRDTLVSSYFSVRNSHGLDTPALEKMRTVLTSLDEEEGLRYLMECWLAGSALIQRSWLEAGEQCFKFEDFLQDAAGQLERMFHENWGIEVERSLIEEVAARHTFKKLSRGRQAGEEDIKSHYRKGIAGDWRAHFTPKLTARFKYLYNDLLVGAGYERDGNW
ncbi:MAG: sulfotransferase domain-containing protein [Verrucomicrobiota bacterium]|jgi:lipopolysaccharide transport system ATP-binding protein